MGNLISDTELLYRKTEASCLQQTADGYALRRLKTDGNISGRIHQRAQCGKKCLNAFIDGMQSTAAVKTLRMKNGRGRKTATGKIDCVPQVQVG